MHNITRRSYIIICLTLLFNFYLFDSSSVHAEVFGDSRVFSDWNEFRTWHERALPAAAAKRR